MEQGRKQPDPDTLSLKYSEIMLGGAVPDSLRTPYRFYMATQQRNLTVNQGFGMPTALPV